MGSCHNSEMGMTHCNRCHESATCQVDVSFGDPLTKIQVNCPFCGNKDALYSWCDVNDVELEVNYIYGNTRKLSIGDHIVAENKHYNVILKINRTTPKYAFTCLWGQEIKLIRDFCGPIHPKFNTSYRFRAAANDELKLIV